MAAEGMLPVAIRDEGVRELIRVFRGVQVMADADLAALYGVETKVLNQAVKRNIARFPEAFRFQLTETESEELAAQSGRSHLRSQIVTSSGHGGRRHLPYVFTEQGVAMLSAVLRSETAVQISIHIINAFVAMRRLLLAGDGLLQRMETLEKRQLAHEIKTDARFDKVLDALESTSPAQGVFFDGQIFDAYVFVNDLLRQAKKSIVLIDNYVDDSVLAQLAKRRKGVTAVILTKAVGKELEQDLARHNAQYPPITVQKFANSHDRFLILDGETVYHLGASLKDLGKKWFGFSKMDKSGLTVMERVTAILGGSRA